MQEEINKIVPLAVKYKPALYHREQRNENRLVVTEQVGAYEKLWTEQK